MPAKGQFSRLICAVEGCGQPPHVYPNGTKAKYCKGHLHLRKGKIRDHENVTYAMESVLRRLRETLDADRDYAFIRLDADYRTLSTLMERDWIVSGDVESNLYRITKRGLDILAKCDKRIVRKDGICPKCGVHPRDGKRAYCVECERERSNAKNCRRRYKTPTKPCRRCKTAPRHQYQPSGTWSDYCSECDSLLRKQRKHTTSRELRELIRQGLKPVPICPICKERPRFLCENSVANYCEVCRLPVFRKYRAHVLYTRYRKAVA